jgi:type VI secretion system protein ImpL
MLLVISIILAVLIIAGIWTTTLLLTWPIWIAIVVTSVAVLTVVGIIVVRRILAAQRAAALERELLKQASDQANKANPQRRAEILALQTKMKSAIEALKKTKLGSKGGKAALSALPWYVIVGPPAAGKTTALEQSGLAFTNPGGGSSKIKGTAGTKNCEWWFSQEAILLDTAGRFTTEDDDQEEWFTFLDIIKRFRPERPLDGVIVAVGLGGGAGTPDLLTANEEQIEELATRLRTRVDEIMTRLEMVVPVYVMFTKADLVAGFVEFWSDFNKQQRGQPWGSTFSIDDERLTEPARACEAEFDLLVATLHARLVDRLNRERAPDARSRILQFPVEFRSLRTPVVSFIEELCKANPYQETPILRGFYFTSGTQVGRPLDRVLAGMARGFGLQQMPDRQGATQAVSYFVTDLLRSIVFPDRNLAIRSSSRVRRSLNRQLLLGGAALLATLLLVLPGTISYVNNAAVVRETAQAVDQIKGVEKKTGRGAAPNADALEMLLDRVQNLEQAKDHFRIPGLWGPRAAADLYEPLREFYVQRLRGVVEGPVRDQVKGDVRAVADNTRNDAEIFQSSYDTLKLYLMMTEPEHLDKEWATTKLAEKWAKATRADENADLERLKAHCHYYIEAMAADRTWVWPAEESTIASARSRLSHEPLEELQYGWLLSNAEGVPPIRPDKVIYGPSAQFITARSRDVQVPGSYTSAGWAKIKPALEGGNARLVIEPWVVGTPIVTGDAAQTNADKLREMYFKQYEQAWFRFLDGLQVDTPKDLKTAIDELRAISDRDGPYTRLFKMVSDNVTLDMEPSSLTGKLLEKGKDMAAGAADKLQGKDSGSGDRQVSPVEKHFKPLIRFTSGDPSNPGDADRAGLNQYLTQVNNLAALLNRLDQQKAEPTTEFQAELARTSAFVDTLTGGLDASTRIVLEPYLMNPIRGSRVSVVGTGNAALNVKWQREVWETWNTKLAGRYPFVDVADEAALTEFVDFFRPSTGALWKFYEQNLAALLERTGNSFTPRASGDPMPFRGDFLQCLGRAQEITDAVLGTGTDPVVAFQLKMQSVGPNISEVTFRVDGQASVYRNEPERWLSTQWPGKGTPHGASLIVKGSGGLTDETPRNGDFGLFRLLATGNIKPLGTEGILTATWPVNRPGEPPVTIQFKPAKSVHPFARDFFHRLKCPQEVIAGGGGPTTNAKSP